jgi:putative tryptophan/tyrosine transport system substrate-binding protein
MLVSALVLAGLVLLSAPTGPVPCVVVGDDRGSAKAAADAAMEALGLAVRVDLQSPGDGSRLDGRCRGVVAVGRAALVAARERYPGPVVAILVPEAALLESDDAPAATILTAPDPAAILATLSELAPGVRRVGLVYDPSVTGRLVARAREVAADRDLEIVALEAADQAAAIRAFASLERDVQIDALWILPDRTTTTYETAHQALKLAHWKRIPVIGPSRWYVANGALFALELRADDHGRLAAERLQALLRGDRGPEVQHVPNAALIVNGRTLGRLGLRLTPALRPQVTEVLQ